jgi:hypothetical protein
VDRQSAQQHQRRLQRALRHPDQAGRRSQAASINKELITAHANLIWNPVSFVDVGLEYTWGQRTVLSNTTGSMNVLISKLAFRF